jgi:hypothetical protein
MELNDPTRVRVTFCCCRNNVSYPGATSCGTGSTHDLQGISISFTTHTTMYFYIDVHTTHETMYFYIDVHMYSISVRLIINSIVTHTRTHIYIYIIYWSHPMHFEWRYRWWDGKIEIHSSIIDWARIGHHPITFLPPFHQITTTRRNWGVVV